MASDAFRWAPIPGAQLSIPLCLESGQVFRWRRTDSGDWVGVIGDQAVRLQPHEDGFRWLTWPEPGRWDLIHRFFALDVDLLDLGRQWQSADGRIGPLLARYAGLRVMRQDPEEAFFGFLCASCNTVVKITRTVEALARRAGEFIGEIGGVPLYRFPTAERIAALTESELRADLWGYRAPRLLQIARHVAAQGPDWIPGLASLPYREAHAELTGLHGIGPKIADCICLFGFGMHEAVPVDVHVRRAAARWYRPDLAQRSLTPAVYNALADLLRDRFGPYAGWAQQYLFMEEMKEP